MTWFKVDDGFAFHPKAIVAGNAALGLWVRAGAWCGANLTDGALPKHMIGTFGAQARDAKKLVAVGLWVETETGYQFHEWAEMQPSKAEVERERAANRKRQQEWRERKRNAVTDASTNAVTDRVTNGAPTRPDPTLKEEANASSKPRKRASRIPNDFHVTDQMKAWHRENCPQVDGPRETVKFINYWQAKSGKDASKLDWAATWRNWMLTAAERTPNTTPTGEIDPDVILGKDYWTPPKAPPGATLEEEIQWKQDRRAEHHRERVEEAKRVMSRAS